MASSRIPSTLPLPRNQTVVHPHEINPPDTVDVTPWGLKVSATDAEIVFRHSGWQRERAQIRAALVANGLSPRKLARYDLCGNDPWVAVSDGDPPEAAILCNTCRNRWCLPCAQARGHRIQLNLQRQIAHRVVRFLTLTVKHSPQPLRQQLDRLYANFRRLRATPFWRQHVAGGAAILEITHSWHTYSWHPHLHCIVEGTYIPHARLSAQWRKITGDSYIVHVTLVRSTHDAGKYVAKYLRKPVDRSIIAKPPILAELIAATRGRRLVNTFGTWRTFRLTAPLDAKSWTLLYPLSELWTRIRDGDPDAPRILASLNDRCPDLLAACWPNPP